MLLAWQMASAQVVTAEQARQRAARLFTKAEVRTKSASVSPDEFKLIGTFPEVTTKFPAAAPVMYIFERAAGGYAIISGDDVARPVLGYSLKGNFPVSDMPDNMRALLQWYADIIVYARQQGWASAQDLEADSGLDPANSVQLQTAQWNQGSPFNDLVPEINGQKPPIGCVATAIAIVMRYHKWPQKGTGALPSYDYSRGGIQYHVEGYPLGHEYDWDRMPEEYGNCSEEEASQIARLLYDVAVMCKMQFYPGGSSSAAWHAMWLSDYFGYDKQITELTRAKGHSDLDWERSVMDEINAGRPVLFSGNRNQAGHAFVVDGYNGRYFSINYGWGGGSNGYYVLTPIDGHEQDLLLYYSDQAMVCRFMPEGEGEATEPFVYLYSTSHLPFDFQTGKAFSLNSDVWNASMSPVTTDFQYVLLDRKDQIKETISSIIRMEVPALGYAYTEDLSCRISKPIEEGDQIVLAMRSTLTGEWIPLTHKRENSVVFTKRPLTELTEIGYAEEPVLSVWSEGKSKRDIYFLVYRDVSWLLYDETGNELLSDRGWGKSSVIQWIFGTKDSNDPQCDRILWEIEIPTGTYTIRLKNPATGEEMELKLVV